jgi:hypothetical protein
MTGIGIQHLGWHSLSVRRIAGIPSGRIADCRRFRDVFPGSRVEADLEALLARMRQRLDPETLPALGSYWFKTVSASGYGRRHWKKLNRLLQRTLGEQILDGPCRQAIVDIQTWIEQTALLHGQPPGPKPPRSDRICATLSSDLLQPYVNQLLNEWLPVEVSRLLVRRDGALPPLIIGRALEGLLVGQRLSPRALEMLLQTELFSPRYVYPADAEILQDVILFLLGRISASPRSVMPASLICLAPDSLLQANYGEAVHHAFLVPQSGGEEVHVPIASAQALEILKGESVRIGSVIVTMDGRWWDAVRLQMGEPHSVVYRPMGRFRLDYVASQVRLRVSFPVNPLKSPSRISFPDRFEIFGREWHLSQWEQDSERACLHLGVSRVLPTGEIVPGSDARLRRWQPESVDMAWSDLEDALTSSLSQGSSEAIERLRHSDLIPLGRAIFELAVSLMSRPLPPCELIETQLRGVDCLEAEVSSKYGRVPGRILPPSAQVSLFTIQPYPELVELLNQVFDSLPERLSAATSPGPRLGKGSYGQNSPL